MEQKSDDFDEDWVESVVQDFTHIRKVFDFVKLHCQMIERKKKEGVVTSTTFPHVNDENGWEYYCFQKRDEKDAIEPLKRHCKYPVASELIQLDYVQIVLSFLTSR